MNEDKGIVLLTGFAGFIGSQILRDLLAKNYIVIGVDNLSEGSSPSNFESLDSGNLLPLFFDMSDPQFIGIVTKLVPSIDFIINCAAQSHVDRSFENYFSFINSNITGAVTMAELARIYKVKKFVHVSTDEVFADSEQPFTETSLWTPQNVYSSTKASAEMLLMNYFKAYGIPLVITNGANTYGPRQCPEKIIPLAITRILEGKKIPVYKTPARRMWLHVEDHSSGIVAAMEKGVAGERYCLAPDSENEVYTLDLVKEICIILGKDPEECISFVPDRPNYDLRYYMLNDKAKKDLNWYPSKNIYSELETVVKWYAGGV